MTHHSSLSKLLLASTLFFSVAACSENNPAIVQGDSLNQSTSVFLDVYKRATCSCCNKWISHVQENGFEVKRHNQSNLSETKEKLGIHPKLQSCHTSVTKDGYVFEGHIPAKYIKKFLADKPVDGKGLAVPAMPTGTPGMEFGDMLQPYKIYLLKTDGSIEIYAEVNSAEEQI